jgi:hypothetical protein
MCAPMILGAVLSIGVAAMQASAEQQAKQADYNARVAAWQQNIINAQTAARDEQRQIITRQLQEQEKTSQKIHVSFLEQAQKQATAEVQGAAAGVSGISLDNILSDIEGKSLLNRTYAEKNYQYVVADTQEQLKATVTRMQGRINSVATPVSPANTSGITILGAVASAFGKVGGSGISM